MCSWGKLISKTLRKWMRWRRFRRQRATFMSTYSSINLPGKRRRKMRQSQLPFIKSGKYYKNTNNPCSRSSRILKKSRILIALRGSLTRCWTTVRSPRSRSGNPAAQLESWASCASATKFSIRSGHIPSTWFEQFSHFLKWLRFQIWLIMC